jgi:hypothetical protein
VSDDWQIIDSSEVTQTATTTPADPLAADQWARSERSQQSA